MRLGHRDGRRLTDPGVELRRCEAVGDAVARRRWRRRPRRRRRSARADSSPSRALRRARSRRGGRAGRRARPTTWWRSSRRGRLTCRRGGVLARLRLPRRPPEPVARRAAASAATPRRPGRLRGAGQRPRRRLSDRLARVAGSWSAAPGSPSSRRGPPYATLAPGDQVRFTVAGAGDRARARAGRAHRRGPRRRMPAPSSRSWPRACAPSSRTVGAGRSRRSVFPTAGPADPVSFDLANRLVGNEPGAGALELTGGGTRLRCLERVPRRRGGGRARGPRRRHRGPGRTGPAAGAGQVLEVGRSARRCRSYVAVAGGFLGPERFGSCASDELTGLGPGPLAARRRAPRRPVGASARRPPRAGLCHRGRHGGAGRSSASSRARIPSCSTPTRWRAPGGGGLRGGGGVEPGRAPAAGRGGRGAAAEQARRRRLDSQGVVTGAVQVPPDGDPVVLLPDHATLGGYPVLAVVASADHGLLGQCAPGTRVRFVPVGCG